MQSSIIIKILIIIIRSPEGEQLNEGLENIGLTLAVENLSFFLSFFLSFLLSFVLFWEFFTRVLADSFSMEFEWQQVSSSLQDSSQYSDRSH